MNRNSRLNCFDCLSLRAHRHSVIKFGNLHALLRVIRQLNGALKQRIQRESLRRENLRQMRRIPFLQLLSLPFKCLFHIDGMFSQTGKQLHVSKSGANTWIDQQPTVMLLILHRCMLFPKVIIR